MWRVRSSSCTAMHMPVSTPAAVRIGFVLVSPSALQFVMSTCITGVLVCCFGWLSALPLLRTHTGRQLLYGRCVSSCSRLSCPVGCWGVGMPCACLASCCSSMFSVMNSPLNVVFSSKFVDPVYSVSIVACLFVVQSSSDNLMSCV